MPRGAKSSYTDKQRRQAEHIEEGYEERGVGKAERRAWATVNKETGGGNKSGSGSGMKDTNVSAKRGGRIGGPRGGKAAASRPAANALREASGRNAQAKHGSEVRRAQGGTEEIASGNLARAYSTAGEVHVICVNRDYGPRPIHMIT